MTFSFAPATRTSTRLLIGVNGPPGAGKTYSALRLATGLADGGKIVFVDTENGRALQYAPREGEKAEPPASFDFVHGVLPPPFTPARYIEIIREAVKCEPAVLIIDSLSHIWDSVGGIRDMHSQAKKKTGRDDIYLWNEPKEEFRKFREFVLQLPTHVIFATKAKDRKREAKNNRGRTELVFDHWHPVIDDSIIYELTINVLMDPQKKGTPTFRDFANFGKLPFNLEPAFPLGEEITEETGRKLLRWSRGEKLEPGTKKQKRAPAEDKPAEEPPAEDPPEYMQEEPPAEDGRVEDSPTDDPPAEDPAPEWIVRDQDGVPKFTVESMSAFIEQLESYADGRPDIIAGNRELIDRAKDELNRISKGKEKRSAAYALRYFQRLVKIENTKAKSEE